MNELINNKIMALSITTGAVGSIIAGWFGGFGRDMETLFILMTADYVTGLLIAAVWGKSPKSDNGALKSNECFKGLIKKGMALLFVLVAHRIDITFGFEYVRTGTIIAFCTNDLISLVENAGLMGLPMPSMITNAIDILKSKESKGGTK